jgi:hypothetical protein
MLRMWRFTEMSRSIYCNIIYKRFQFKEFLELRNYRWIIMKCAGGMLITIVSLSLKKLGKDSLQKQRTFWRSVPLEKFNLMQMLTRLVSETFRNTSYTFSGQKNRFRNVCLLTFHRRRIDEMINNTVPLGKNVLCRPRCDRLKNIYFRKLF